MTEKKYAIHPDFAHFPVVNLSFRPLVVGLLNMLMRFERFVRRFSLLRKATRHHLNAPDGHRFKVLQFMPPVTNGAVPAVIYLHGGAYVLTYASSHIYSVDYYAREAGCAVFLVDYRLAHRHPCPRGFDDCNATLAWVLEQAARLGIDPNRIAVMGDSAGGGLAAGMAQKATDDDGPALRGQVLIYPTLDHRCATESANLFVDTPLWNAVSNREMWRRYLQPFTQGAPPPYASPADRADLHELPPAYIETAEFDPLRDEALDYASRLEAAGVAVKTVPTQATIHGFDTVFGSELVREVLRGRVAYLKAIFR